MVRIAALIIVSSSACVTPTPLLPTTTTPPLPTPYCEVWGVSAVFDGGEDMRPAPVCFLRCHTSRKYSTTESVIPVDCDQWEGRRVVAQRL